MDSKNSIGGFIFNEVDSQFNPIPVEIKALPRTEHLASTITMREHFSLEILKAAISGRNEYNGFRSFLTAEDFKYITDSAEKFIAYLDDSKDKK
jgi:hypothetical protein